MRRLFTTADALAGGRTMHELRWGVRAGRWQRVERSVYAHGPEPVTALDRARSRVLATGSPARAHLAGVLLDLDRVELRGSPTHRRPLPDDRIIIVEGIPCANGLQTLIDLAATLDDDGWELVLESALRKGLTSIAELEAQPRLPERARRVLARRPAGAPPTGSLLETLALQLARTIPGVGDPVRQYEVIDRHGQFVARVDLSWPDNRVFFELDGQQHRQQPVYDARRQTAVVAATGMLPGRYTWYEITRIPVATRRRMIDLFATAVSRS